MKEKIPKPQFKKICYWLFVGITSILGAITVLVPNISQKKIPFNITLSWLLFFGLLLIISSLLIVNYIIDVNKKYKKYEQQFEEYKKMKENNEALKETLEKRQLEIKKLKKELEEHDLVLNSIISRIQQGACNISGEEKKYLNNLYSLVLADKSYLFKPDTDYLNDIDENGEN